MSKILEPVNVTSQSENYISDLTRALTWYNWEKDKKEARQYLKSFVGKDKGKIVDRLPDSAIVNTFAWIARLKTNGCTLKQSDEIKFQDYIKSILSYKVSKEPVIIETSIEKPSVRDYLEDKIKDYLGELEGTLDSIILEGKDFNLFKDMQSRALPVQYIPSISLWIKRKAGEFIAVYETDDKEVKAAYDRLGKRGLTSLIKMFNQWLEDLEKYSQFKKANRKPRVKKLKPAGVQVRKLNYKKEDDQLKIKSINPTEIIGASQVWIYNTKYKRMAVYRSDSRDGLQVKGSSVQNYDPAQCEQKSIRNPSEVISKVIDGGKLVLRKLLTDLKTKDYPVTGRINDECIIIRAIK